MDQQLQTAENNSVVSAADSSATNPAEILRLAVEQNADVDKLEKLMELKERWEANEARKAFVQAMNQFRQDPPQLTRNKHVNYPSKGGQTDYWHATLDHACEVIGKALAEVGISYRWRTEQLENGMVRVTCILTHRDGHSEETPLQAMPDNSGGKNSIQAVGSAVTYLERYTLLAATGMASEEQDDDGMAADQPDPAEAHPDALSNAQQQALMRRIKDAGMSDRYFCKAAGINAISELHPSRYSSAMGWLKEKAYGGTQ